MSTVPSLFLPQVLCTFARRWMYSHLHYHRLQRADLSATDTRCEPCGPFRDWQREERDSTLLTNQDVWKCQTERMKRAKCFLTEKWRDCGTLNGSITRARVAAAQKKKCFSFSLELWFRCRSYTKDHGTGKRKEDFPCSWLNVDRQLIRCFSDATRERETLEQTTCGGAIWTSNNKFVWCSSPSSLSAERGEGDKKKTNTIDWWETTFERQRRHRENVQKLTGGNQKELETKRIFEKKFFFPF